SRGIAVDHAIGEGGDASLDCADQMPNGTLLWKGWQWHLKTSCLYWHWRFSSPLIKLVKAGPRRAIPMRRPPRKIKFPQLEHHSHRITDQLRHLSSRPLCRWPVQGCCSLLGAEAGHQTGWIAGAICEVIVS